MKYVKCLMVPAMLTLALAAQAQVTVDGKMQPGENYGAAKWYNKVYTNLNKNIPVTSVGDPQNVVTGIEIAIPLNNLGLTVPFSGALGLKVAACVASGNNDYFSNQFLGSLASNTGNLGGRFDANGPLPLDLSSATDPRFAGAQFFTTNSVTTTSTAITIDGRRDEPSATNPYGTLPTAPNARIQANYTQFGDATHGKRGGTQGGVGATPPGYAGAEGSELDNLTVRRDANNLYIFIGGNLEGNGNRLNIFLDTGSGGQSTISGIDPNTAGLYNGLNGITFDSPFAPKYIVGISNTELDRTNSPGIYRVYCDFLSYNAGAWTSTFAGRRDYENTGTLTDTVGTLKIDDPANPGQSINGPLGIRVGIDNSNIAGVIGTPIVSGGNRDIASGSEIDAVYARTSGNTLNLMITGNLNANFDKLVLFFDNGNPGQNRLRGASLPANGISPYYKGNIDISFGGLNRMGADQFNVDPTTGERTPSNGLKFDTDFSASYFMDINNGNNPIENYVDAAVLRPNGRRETSSNLALDYGSYYGGQKAFLQGGVLINDPINFSGPRADAQPNDPFAGGNDIFANFPPRLLADRLATVAGTPATPDTTGLANKIVVAIDNSNVAGVGVTPTQTDALAVTTGVEIAISFDELGWNGTSPLKLAGFLTAQSRGGGFAVVSNQVIGDIPPSANDLGDPRLIDFSNVTGTQWVLLAGGGVTPCNAADVASLGTGLGAGGTRNPDGQNTVDDIIAYLSAFFGGNNGVADLIALGGALPATPDGQITVDDLIYFLNQFFSACNP
jgi:hypothetical protein